MATLWAAATSYPLEDAPQRDRGHHLGGSSSVWRCSRKELAYSSSSSSSDESFAPALEHAWNMMMLCSLMRIVECVTLQPVLSGRALFGACVCCRVSTRVVQTCAVTCHGPYTTNSCPTAPPGSARGHIFSGARGRAFIERLACSMYVSARPERFADARNRARSGRVGGPSRRAVS